MGSLTLFIIVASIYLIQKEKSFIAGLLLAFTMFKPPQGLVILLLIGIWSLARGDWKIIQGILLGGVILWIVGAAIDLNWVGKFLHSSGAAFDRRLGFQSNVWSFSHLVCRKDTVCGYILGGACSLILVGLSAFYLWRKQSQLTAWDAMNLMIPIGFVSTVYLWSYDQILYIIPIIWILGTLVQKTRKYIYAFIFLIIILSYAFFALVKLSELAHDLWSLGNTLIVLIALFITVNLKQKA